MSKREDLMAQSALVMREFMAHAVLFQEAVGRAAGLNGTDLQALGILLADGPMSPGQLAQRTGITSGGAITLLLDRLEEAGLARRTRDQHDRRRVLVSADADRVMQHVGPLYEPVSHRWNDYLETLTTDQLRTCLDLLRAAVAINRGEIERLGRAEPERPSRRRRGRGGSPGET
jgi:predicted transcriptional regulator